RQLFRPRFNHGNAKLFGVEYRLNFNEILFGTHKLEHTSRGALHMNLTPPAFGNTIHVDQIFVVNMASSPNLQTIVELENKERLLFKVQLNNFIESEFFLLHSFSPVWNVPVPFAAYSLIKTGL